MQKSPAGTGGLDQHFHIAITRNRRSNWYPTMARRLSMRGAWLLILKCKIAPVTND
jgi:hypothetical protein